ncbi:cytochrome c550 [Virgibacillus sp. YIM 98842]|jgi:mono/diheme cytochrome c family protein|uniref:cytochrome c550 n=1 Tax=Virgibacillus sp. YIM 98842 TaxID=2663533 RepID=UPI0013DD3549|nr:cytochrome c [Virgibacillus sp. YIM 98842]
MKRNPVIPFAIIAAVGILLVIIISFQGANQRDDIAQQEEGGDAQTEEGQQEDSQEGETTDDPSEVFETNCASCHGADLSGGAGPELVEVGSRLSEDEIYNIIMQGQGSMPGGLVSEEEAQAISTWLLEEQ